MNLAEVGYFSKTHGLKGQVHLTLTNDFDIEKCNAIFVDFQSGKVPHFISEFRETNKGFVIAFEDIDSIDLVKNFVGKRAFVQEEFVYEDESAKFLGFKVIDKNFGEIGLIDSVEESAGALLLSVMHNKKEVLLPFEEDFIESIDEDKKVINYIAPDGLIDMYLK